MKLFFLAVFFLVSFFANAQYKLVFTNTDSSEVVVVEQKSLVNLSYSGYMKQQQEASGYVTNITDSSITLQPRRKFLQKATASKTFLIKDITGFRRFSKFRPASEVIYSFLSVGVTGTVTAIIANANIPASLSFLSAAGTQTATTLLKNVFFSSKIKNKLSSGWNIHVMK
jgi:hypothetical protein